MTTGNKHIFKSLANAQGFDLVLSVLYLYNFKYSTPKAKSIEKMGRNGMLN